MAKAPGRLQGKLDARIDPSEGPLGDLISALIDVEGRQIVAGLDSESSDARRDALIRIAELEVLKRRLSDPLDRRDVVIQQSAIAANFQDGTADVILKKIAKIPDNADQSRINQELYNKIKTKDRPDTDLKRNKSKVYFDNIEIYQSNDEMSLEELLDKLADVRRIPLESRELFKKDVMAWNPPASVGSVAVRVLPDYPPARYVDRPKGQNIIEFLCDPKGWGPYVEAELLTRPELRRYDKQAARALDNWLQNNVLPSGIRIPKKSEVTDRMAAAFPDPATRPAGLDSTLRTRQRRATNG